MGSGSRWVPGAPRLTASPRVTLQKLQCLVVELLDVLIDWRVRASFGLKAAGFDFSPPFRRASPVSSLNLFPNPPKAAPSPGQTLLRSQSPASVCGTMPAPRSTRRTPQLACPPFPVPPAPPQPPARPPVQPSAAALAPLNKSPRPWRSLPAVRSWQPHTTIRRLPRSAPAPPPPRPPPSQDAYAPQ